ncbi:MAG: PAS domain S-box protein [Bacteroidota bacterium]|nr:PAS domain S-box protein [Bacteroidota bacterium]
MKIKAAENIFNLFDDAVLVADSSGKVIYGNNALFEMFKTKKADVFGKNVYEWKNGRLKQLESIVSKILSQKIIVKDFELQLPDFTNKVIKVNVREESDIIKPGSNILFVFREIGDKQCNEENRNLSSAISSINDAVCLTDLNHHLTFVNEAFLKLYGYTQREIIGKHVKILRSSRMDQETINAIMATVTTGGFIDEIWNRKKDGTEFLVQLSTGVIKNDKGETTAFIGVAKDITERKIAEEKLNLLSEQRKKLVEISEFLFSTLSLDELLERVFKSLGEVIHYEASELYWLNEEEQLLESTLIPGSMTAESGFQNWSIPPPARFIHIVYI